MRFLSRNSIPAPQEASGRRRATRKDVQAARRAAAQQARMTVWAAMHETMKGPPR